MSYSKKAILSQWKKYGLVNKQYWDNWKAIWKKSCVYRINSKWIENINVKSEIIRALDESMKKFLYDRERSEAIKKAISKYIKIASQLSAMLAKSKYTN